MPIKATLRVKFDFEGTREEELSLKEGDYVYLLYEDASGWAKGRSPSSNLKGWFPIEYTEVVQEGEMDLESILSQQDGNKVGENTSTMEDSATVEITTLKPPKTARDNIVDEILITERTYINNLTKVTTFWMSPLRSGAYIDTKYIPKIFCNIEEIFAVNIKLLVELETRIGNWTPASSIGDIFLEFIPKFSVYEEYLKNHHTAIMTVNQLAEKKSSFSSWIQSVKASCEGLDLLAFLIMPVQRILRYKLFFTDLVKHTPDTHPDYPLVQEALDKIALIATNVNESIKIEENFQKLCKIQRSFVGNFKNIVKDGRQFIREGPVMKVCRKTHKPRWFFLFSDVLVYASVSTGGKRSMSARGTLSQSALTKIINPSKQEDNTKYLFHRMISLECTRVKTVEDQPPMKNAFEINTTEEKSFIVYTETVEDRDNWVAEINKLTGVDDLGQQAPVWVQDSQAKACMLCEKKFTVVTRRHHCRFCGNVVCAACSSHNISRSHLGSKPVRVCNECYIKLGPEESSQDESSVPTTPDHSAPTTPTGSIKRKNSSFMTKSKKDSLAKLPKNPPTPSNSNSLTPNEADQIEDVAKLRAKIRELTILLQNETAARIDGENELRSIIEQQNQEIEWLKEVIEKQNAEAQ